MNWFKKIINYIKGFWSKAEISPEIPASVPNRTRKKRTDTAKKQEIGDLLDGLKGVFEQVRKTDMKQSWVNKSTREALRAMGPSYPDKDHLTPRVIEFKSGMVFPTLMFVALGDEYQHDDGFVYARFMFAHKIDKLPLECTRETGDAIYECGCAYPFEGNLFWMKVFVVVDSASQKVKVVKYAQQRRFDVGKSSFSRRVWDNGYGHSDDDVAAMFALTFNLWTVRDEMWKISTRQAGYRATFCIHRKKTSSFFKDRGRTAMTADGHLRPIMHHVRPHTRKLADGRVSDVKEHVRGIRAFDWNGYKCAIIAPEFDRIHAGVMDLSTTDEVEGTFAIEGKDIGQWIAETEDNNRPAKPHLTLVVNNDHQEAA